MSLMTETIAVAERWASKIEMLKHTSQIITFRKNWRDIQTGMKSLTSMPIPACSPWTLFFDVRCPTKTTCSLKGKTVRLFVQFSFVVKQRSEEGHCHLMIIASCAICLSKMYCFHPHFVPLYSENNPYVKAVVGLGELWSERAL